MLTVGGVVKALAADFPGITVSKVRFLEAEGIVTPARTAAGYRQFSAGDLERLRFALTAQRDRFWPLRRVREALDALDRGVSLEEFGATVAPVAATPSVDLPRSQTVRLTRAELLSASGLEPAMADDLVSYGLLTPSRRGHFSAADLQVAGDLLTADLEDGARTLIEEANTAAVDLGRPLHDREAQPADGVATGLLGAAIEAVEDPLAVDGRDEGAVSADGRVLGTYLHGLFAADGFRRSFLDRLGAPARAAARYEAAVETALDAIADGLEQALDLDALLALAGPVTPARG